ncbi:2891_t:CDS:2 [Funneliformis mosseae]|uniref:2891_t:CDS:1 n=1 Tax=Funneliformis mosseae TaxID=27381 RepID=A0A9N9AM71_FUNMO|nr:2891_t:CDS:2 [Funneliformis mosseae]
MSGYEFFTSGAPKQTQESTWNFQFRKLFTIKTLKDFEVEKETSGFKRTLSAFDLIMIGLGGIIGTGILVITGQAAATKAGPAVVISFIISGIAASFAALSYSELSSMIPISGSAYTFVYATLGELAAWIIGWDLILEYAVGASTIAVGWSGYLVHFFENTFNVHFSPSWTSAPLLFDHQTGYLERIPGAYINLPALLLIISITIILTLGIKESATVNNIIVGIKTFVIVLFVIVASTKINPKNYDPFIPPNEGSFEKFGVTGILSASSVVFFAYIGFDSISTTAQEAKNPQRNLPIGIISSLIICTILYVAVCVTLTGVVPYTELDSPAPVAVAINAMGMKWLGTIVDFGALVGLISGVLVLLVGQPRIFYSMAKDGLLFPAIAKLHPKFKTPYISTIITGAICSTIASLLPIGMLAELTSVGTLLAFFLVNVGVMLLRITAPNAPRKFKVPGGPYVIPIIGALLDLLLLYTATPASLERLFIWMAIGLLVYFFYGRFHSVANHSNHYMKNKELNEGG